MPFFGIALGMQLALIEYARNVLGLKNAHSTEFDPDTSNIIIDLAMPRKDSEDQNGTMRLGVYPCKLDEDTKVSTAYGKELIYERHRNRYEFNNEYREQLQEAGIIFSGNSPDVQFVETIELQDHPFFVACQFHPEFASRPTRPQPLISAFLKAILSSQK